MLLETVVFSTTAEEEEEAVSRLASKVIQEMLSSQNGVLEKYSISAQHLESIGEAKGLILNLSMQIMLI